MTHPVQPVMNSQGDGHTQAPDQGPPSEVSVFHDGHAQILAKDLRIRRMRDEDVAKIMPIESVSFGRHHWSEESFFNEMKNQMARYYVLVHLEPGEDPGPLQVERVIGYCGFWVILDELHITTIAVQPDLRRHSLGELLVAHMLERALGQIVHWVTLEVRVSNYGAQNLYYKYGFNSVGNRPRYYQDNEEDALIMTTPKINEPEMRGRIKANIQALEQRLKGLPEGFGL